MKAWLAIFILLPRLAVAGDVIDCAPNSTAMQEFSSHLQKTCEPKSFEQSISQINEVLRQAQGQSYDPKLENELYDKIYARLEQSNQSAHSAFKKRFQKTTTEAVTDQLNAHLKFLNSVLTSETEFNADRFQIVTANMPLLRLDPTPDHLRIEIIEKRYQETYAYVRKETLKRDPNGIETLLASNTLLGKVGVVYPVDFEETAQRNQMAYKKLSGDLSVKDVQTALREVDQTYHSIQNRLAKERRTRQKPEMGGLTALYPQEVFQVLKENPHLAPAFCRKLRQSNTADTVKEWIQSLFDGSNGLLMALGIGQMLLPQSIEKKYAKPVLGVLRASAGMAFFAGTLEGAKLLKDREDSQRRFEALLNSTDGQLRENLLTDRQGLKSQRQETSFTRMAIAIGVFALLKWDLNRTKATLEK